MAIQSSVTPTPVSQDLRATLSLLWHRIKRQGPLPPWTVETFARPLLPHETTLTYHMPNSTQVSPLEKTLLDLQMREASRYATTAIAASQEHQCPCVEQLFNAQLLPHTVLQKPMPAEAEAILALPLRLRKLVMTKIMHRFATMGLNTSLLVDCPGLGGDSLGLSPPPDITICCLAVGNTQVYGPTLTPVDKVDPNGHIVSYGNTSGVHEMTIALLGIEQNAMRWEKLGLGTASDILHRTLLVLRHAQRLPAHRRPPHAIFLGACTIKLSLYHPCSQRHWLHLMHDAFVTPFTESRPIRLRGFSAGSYTAATVALLLAQQITSWRIQLSLGAYAGPATILTALCAKAVTGQVATNIVHLQADQLCLWGATAFHFMLSDPTTVQSLLPYRTASMDACPLPRLCALIRSPIANWSAWSDPTGSWNRWLNPVQAQTRHSLAAHHVDEDAYHTLRRQLPSYCKCLAVFEPHTIPATRLQCEYRWTSQSNPFLTIQPHSLRHSRCHPAGTMPVAQTTRPAPPPRPAATWTVHTHITVSPANSQRKPSHPQSSQPPPSTQHPRTHSTTWWVRRHGPVSADASRVATSIDLRPEQYRPSMARMVGRIHQL